MNLSLLLPSSDLLNRGRTSHWIIETALSFLRTHQEIEVTTRRSTAEPKNDENCKTQITVSIYLWRGGCMWSAMSFQLTSTPSSWFSLTSLSLARGFCCDSADNPSIYTGNFTTISSNNTWSRDHNFWLRTITIATGTTRRTALCDHKFINKCEQLTRLNFSQVEFVGLEHDIT